MTVELSFLNLYQFKRVEDVISWSMFRDVCALFLDHRTAPPLSSLPGSCPEDEMTNAKKEEDKRSAWIALAKVHIEAGGGKVVQDVPILQGGANKLHANTQRRLSGSGRKQKLGRSLAHKGITHVVCCEKLLKGERSSLSTYLQEQLHLDMHRVLLVTDYWVQSSFSYRRLPVTDEYIFSPDRPAHVRPSDDDERTFVSSPFPDCREDPPASGMKWEQLSSEKPKSSTEICNLELAKALQHKVDFSQEECAAFGLSNLPYESCINVKGTYFKQAMSPDWMVVKAVFDDEVHSRAN